MSARQVRVAQLKARLSEYLRMVRRGHAVTVLDRDTPIARIVPHDAPELRVRQPAPRVALRDVPVPPPLDLKGLDVVELLRAERQGER
jgi:prevent-host-death family protein